MAYDFQFKALQDLAKTNLNYFSEIQKTQKQRDEIQLKLDASVKALRKKKSNWILPTALGVVGGLVGGVIISR